MKTFISAMNGRPDSALTVKEDPSFQRTLSCPPSRLLLYPLSQVVWADKIINFLEGDTSHAPRALQDHPCLSEGEPFVFRTHARNQGVFSVQPCLNDRRLAIRQLIAGLRESPTTAILVEDFDDASCRNHSVVP